MMTNQDIITLDSKGQDCPQPLIELKEVVATAESGQIIEHEFTCPEATTTIPNYAAEEGLEVVKFEKLGTEGWKIVLKK